MQFLSETSVRHPKVTVSLIGVMAIVTILLAALPSVMPEVFSFLHPVSVDTDPENMLAKDEPVRVFHNEMKSTFRLYDMIVVGVTNPGNDNGVFNPESLKKVFELAEAVKEMRWKNADGEMEGVVDVELMAPSTVDNIQPGSLGTVQFEWLMPEPPTTQEEALSIRDKAKRLPMFDGTIVSDSGDALALYVPLTSKDVSYQVATKIEKKASEFGGTEEFYVTGLPVAQDTFGVEMFVQMAVSAPLAMLLIFILMWIFFRQITIIISPLIVAMVSVIMSMGLLVINGNTIHIMSSMIPIFVMPIAVLDSVHILSEFFDRYQKSKDRYKTLSLVMDELSAPMFYTSLTTCAGFASLALTPIPPVQVFGIYVSLGVFFAWIFTVTIVPAYIALLPESSLQGFGLTHSEDEEHLSWMGRAVKALGPFTYNYAKPILLLVVILGVISAYGISQITINDNPVKWFTKTHKIRVADRVLNEKFAGTYMAYLTLSPGEATTSFEVQKNHLREKLSALGENVVPQILAEFDKQAEGVSNREELLAKLKEQFSEQLDAASDETFEAWEDAMLALETEKLDLEVFKQPEVLRYIADFQKYLLETGYVGKSNSLADVVKTVHRELYLGEQEKFSIPDSVQAVGQTLVTFQNSHRPNDLWHFVTSDYRTTNLWIQLKSGDNKDMSALVSAVEKYFAEHAPPQPLNHNWFGLTYINVVWQQKMVSGMLEAFLGSFIIVLIMMVFLFRSLVWGVLSMIPLTVTIAIMYGILGLIGKDYDMPVAVLSSLSLGLAVDYAIHFLARSRHLRAQYSSWKETVEAMFGEPGRAIARNVIVIGVGFMPLLAAPLVPYQTVGALISAILLLAGIATLLILPAILRLIEPIAFSNIRKEER
ncbi:MAG: MMPL family transporter [Bdellovibrionales bacterium]|nr:MMPL family transporter [Bdellovibrionales bacterium]